MHFDILSCQAMHVLFQNMSENVWERCVFHIYCEVSFEVESLLTSRKQSCNM